MSETLIRYQRPKLYPKQEAAIFCDARYGLIEASTKAGKTVGCLAWLLEQAMHGKPGHQFWWVAPVKDQANIAYRRMKRGLPLDKRDTNETHRTITLRPFDTTISFKSADEPDSLYGEDVYACVIDEATRCKEESWFAIRSTLTATQGPVRIIGNVKGRKNWAYHLARKAEAGEPGMHYAKMTAYDAIEAGVLDPAEIADAKRQLPEMVFNELYLAIPADDGGNPFNLAAIHACLIDQYSRLAPVVWGWDLAKSVDWTVGIALDANGQVCQLVRQQKPWEDTFHDIARWTNRVPALVDSTGVGDPVLERLQRHAGGQFEGYQFSQASKQRLMEGLAVAIQQQQIRFPDGPIRTELESFEYQYTKTGVRYSAPDGQHDDCVCALALAAHLFEQRRGWTLKVWGGGLDAPLTEEEKQLAALARQQAAQDAVTEAIARDGLYWGR